MTKQTENRLRYSIRIDIEIMRSEMDMTDKEIKNWFNTPCNDETGYNGYLAEEVPAGNITVEELNIMLDKLLTEKTEY